MNHDAGACGSKGRAIKVECAMERAEPGRRVGD